MKSIPSMPVNGDGEKEAVPVYLSFFYRCATKGTLRVQFLRAVTALVMRPSTISNLVLMSSPVTRRKVPRR